MAYADSVVYCPLSNSSSKRLLYQMGPRSCIEAAPQPLVLNTYYVLIEVGRKPHNIQFYLRSIACHVSD